jgi:hypothetical protein
MLRVNKDYFHSTNPTYLEHKFGHHFRMSRKFFLHILDSVRDYDSYFRCNPDAIGKLGFNSYQNVPQLFACLHMELQIIFLMSTYE